MNSMAWIAVFVAALSVPTMGSFEVSTGQTNTCVVNDGEVKCWGENDRGQLGIGNKVDQWAPLEEYIDLGTDFMADSLECGQDFCCALSTEKDVKCFGKCDYIGCYGLGYGTGLGDEEDELGDNLPIVSPSFVGVVDMVALGRMVCVLTEDADGAHLIECVGYDINGNVWREHQDDTPWTVEYSASWDNSRLVTSADDDTAHLDLSELSWTPNGLGGGQLTLCVFDSTTVGALECHGRVDVDEERTGSLSIESVYCGKWHCCAKSTSGSVVCWGGNPTSTKYGQNEVQPLIVEDNVQDYSVAKFSACVLSTDGMLSCFGYDQLDDGPFDISSSFSDVSKVHLAHSRSSQFDFCLYEDAANPKVQCFGRNREGQLGYGDQVARTSAEGLDDVDLLLPGTGCDAASFIDRGCPEGADCLLDNGRWSGSCCTSEFLCLEGEGDCDSDDDCADSLVCGTDNCDSSFGGSTTMDTHDCCTTPQSIAVSDRAASKMSISDSVSGADDESNPDGNGIWRRVVIGAVIGVVVIGAVVLLAVLMLKRRRRLGMKAETEMCRAVDIEEPLPNEDEIAGTTTTAEAVDTESCTLNVDCE